MSTWTVWVSPAFSPTRRKAFNSFGARSTREAGVGRRGAETLAVILPIDQIGRGENPVFPTAITGAPAYIVGAVEVEAAIGPLPRFNIRDKMLDGENRVHFGSGDLKFCPQRPVIKRVLAHDQSVAGRFNRPAILFIVVRQVFGWDVQTDGLGLTGL